MSAPAVSAPILFRKPRVSEVAVLLIVAWLVPFLVHLLPWSGPRPIGAYLLPMFWTVFVAIYFYGAITGLVTALVVPVVNLIVTGLPSWNYTVITLGEGVVYVIAALLLLRRFPRLWLNAALAYVAAKLVVTAIQGLLGQLSATPLTNLGHSLERAFAGLAVLAVINATLVQLYPKSR